MKKIFVSLFLVSFFGFNSLYGQSEKEGISRQMAGLSFGSRSISLKSSEVYFEGEKVDFGSLSPFTMAIFYQKQTESNLALNIAIDFSFSKTFAGAGLVGVGYRFGNRRFSIIPLLSLGGGIADTKLKEYELGSDRITLGKKVFIGEDAFNKGRGKGEKLDLSVSSGFFITKPEIQAQFYLGKIMIMGSVGYNFAFQGKGRIELSGKGYDSEDEYDDSVEAPKSISVESKISEYLEDDKFNPIASTPLQLSGFCWSFGLAYKFAE
jgi:hypothetical protein